MDKECKFDYEVVFQTVSNTLIVPSVRGPQSSNLGRFPRGIETVQNLKKLEDFFDLNLGLSDNKLSETKFLFRNVSIAEALR